MGDVINPQDATPMSRPEFEAYIDKQEVARRIGKTVRTVDTWMAEGRLPFYKIGKTVCFKWSEVDRHIQENFRVRQCGK